MQYFKATNKFKLEFQSVNAQFRSKLAIFNPMWPWNLTKDLEKQYGTSFMHLYIKLCASFYRHRLIQTGLTVWKHQIWVKISNFVPSDLEFGGWHWKTIEYHFYVTSSFVNHFVAICEVKLELRSVDTKFGTKLAILCPVGPWNSMDDLEKQWVTFPLPHQALCTSSLSYVTSNLSYGPETAKFGFDLCGLDLWPLILTMMGT